MSLHAGPAVGVRCGLKGYLMMVRPELDRQVTRERLLELLGVHAESDALDFKQTLDLHDKLARAELARDVLAFMNTEGGGHLVFGVEDGTFCPVGLSLGVQLDTTKVCNALAGYIDGTIPCIAATYALRADEVGATHWTGTRPFGILYIARRRGSARPRCEVAFPDASGKMQPVLRVSDVLVRRGAQTVLANAADVERLHPTPVSDASAATADDGGHDDPSALLVTSLPAREEIATHFVGRHEELEQLAVWLRDPQSRQRLLAGDGGKGKSAIAFQLAGRLRVEAPAGLVGVLWVSAKRRRFVDGVTQPIARPDFWDLESLLDAVARGYGWDEYVELPSAEKQHNVLELLRDLPVLLVADDIDSLEGTGDDAYMFLISDVLQTPSKVLLTSRDVKFGLNKFTIQVAGFTDTDGADFVRSRVRLFGLDSSVFTSRIVRDILRVTDSSPLYIEDLLRLCAVLPAADAIARWRERGGDAAREYALKREFDRLSDPAKRVVIAACLYDGPVSFVELQRVTGLSEQQMLDGIGALQKLFLVSRPRLIEGVERYDVNVNTRRLIRDTQGRERPELMRQLTEAYLQVTGRSESRRGREIASYIRQATALQSLGRDDDAEATILAALAQHPDHASLLAQLGIIALRRRPPNATDARAHFRRAAQLKCPREQMYLLWAHLEEGEGEWQAALQAVEQGRANVGDTMHLLYDAGYAHSRWGQQFLRELHEERAYGELRAARACYVQALKGPEELVDEEERQLNGRILRGLVIVGEALCRIDPAAHSTQTWRWAKRWAAEYPTDVRAHEALHRFRTRYPQVDQMASRR